jgi:hypothetical protein
MRRHRSVALHVTPYAKPARGIFRFTNAVQKTVNKLHHIMLPTVGERFESRCLIQQI